METTNKNSLTWLLIASAICAGVTLLFVFIPQAVILVSVVITIIWLKWRGVSALIPFTVFMTGAFFIIYTLAFALAPADTTALKLSFAVAVLLICLTIPTTITAVLMHRAKSRMYDGVLRTTLASLAGVAAAVAFIYVYMGQGVPELILSFTKSILQTAPDQTQLLYDLLTQIIGSLNGTTVANAAATHAHQISFIIGILEETIPISLGSLALSYALLNGFTTYYVPYLFLKNKQVDLVKAPEFKDLRIPKPEWIVLVFIYFATILFGYSESVQIFTVASIIQPAIRMVFTVQGAALLIYFYKTKRLSLALTLVFTIVGLLFNIVFWLGLLEAMMQIRARLKNETDTRSL